VEDWNWETIFTDIIGLSSTKIGWQVTLCDPIWHVSSRSGDGRLACKLLYPSLLYFFLITTHSACNLGFIFDEHLTFSDQISALSKSCYYHIHELRSIRLYLDFKTASTIATSIVHSKLDYCNSLYYNLPQSQIKRLQNIQNSLDHTVTRTPKSAHITPLLKSLHWLKINECIKYKLLSL